MIRVRVFPEIAALTIVAVLSLSCEAVDKPALESPTEGRITVEPVSEAEMMDGLLASLAQFSQYMSEGFLRCRTHNLANERCGCFKSNRTMTNTEAGVRTNADMSMLCAFLVKYAEPLGIVLPAGVDYRNLERMARESLVYAYSTHKAVRLKTCEGGGYWGSTSSQDMQWESSLWAFSLAWSAFFQWNKLSDSQKTHIRTLLMAECDYELQRVIPYGYVGNTRAEENGWEVCVLAATLGLFPDDPMAPAWFERMREFAVNSYSHPSDSLFITPVDSWYDNKSVSDMYVGPNLYEDYTLRNHGFFHSSYQNVVIQELGEAALALRMFQEGLGREIKWHSNALFHNVGQVMDRVLADLALADGELAMPNSNDWSLFLFDQITSYSTLSTFLRMPDALMLENQAYKNIIARQSTTSDGAWLLLPDIGARRMGVQGHRVMMTWLMHYVNSTADLVPSEWEDFRASHSSARIFPCQRVIRALSPSRFVVFSYSEGLNDCSGYIASNRPDRNKVFVPFRKNGTGNLIGWYDVQGKKADAVLTREPFYLLEGDSFVTGSVLRTNEMSLETRFSLYASPGNAVLYVDHTKACDDVTVTGERGILTAVSVDAFTRKRRMVSFAGAAVPIDSVYLDGSSMFRFRSTWANIDGSIGIVTCGRERQMAFGDRENNKSILTAKYYGSYSDKRRRFASGDQVGKRAAVFYTDISAVRTAELAEKIIELENGMIIPDTDGSVCLLAVSEMSQNTLMLPIKFSIDTTFYPGVPVFEGEVSVLAGENEKVFKAFSTLTLKQDGVTGQTTRLFLIGDNVHARRISSDNEVLYLCSLKGSRCATVLYVTAQGDLREFEIDLPADGEEVRLDILPYL